MKKLSYVAASLAMFGVTTAATAGGALSNNIRIESASLDYALQYRVYTPEGYDDMHDLPTLYVTDGQYYLREGKLHKELDRQIEAGTINPVVAVFVDNRNPDDLSENRRNRQFFCNQRYADFYSSELVPTISEAYNVSDDRSDRVILGLSFGGLNSGCFGILATDTFEGIAMQSPAMHPVPELHDAYANYPKRPLKIFLSAGNENEITRRTKRLKEALEAKGYPVMYRKNREGHNWRNWRPLLDDILLYFFER